MKAAEAGLLLIIKIVVIGVMMTNDNAPQANNDQNTADNPRANDFII